MENRRRWAARALIGAVCTLGAAVFLVAVPFAVRFGRTAPSEFWAITALAIIADASVPGVLRRTRQANRTTLSACLAFAIFLIWGSAPAIVVQALAGVIAAVARRLGVREGAFMVARLVLALAAAEITVAGYLHRRPVTEVGSGLTGVEVVDVLPPVLAWFVVSFGLVALARLLRQERGHREGGLRAVAASIREDMFGTAVLMLLVSPLLTTMSGWWSAVLVVPLLAWNQLNREQASQEQRLSREPVTGVLNRQGLVAGLEAYAADDPVGRARPFAVIFVNVESVLEVNRTLGRQVYEHLVGEVAQRLIELVGAERVGRLSGEGFVVLVPDQDEAASVARAEEIVARLAQPIEVDGIPFGVEPATGIALSPRDGRDFGSLVSKAETAMVAARRRGQRTRVYVPEVAAVISHRVGLLADLHDALRDPARSGEIAMLYQPQVDLRTGRLVGVEALLRWTRPGWGEVPTEELIRSIEPSQVMHVLTARILDLVATQLRAWARAGLTVRAAVNVSVHDLSDEGFVDRVRSTLDTYGLDPAQLTIEITEGMLIADAPRVTRAARGIAALGVGLSLDDFGTGFASLQQLRLLPLTEVKIDKSYVSAMVADPVQRAIVVSVHELAQALGLVVVAEGVEDLTTVKALARLRGTIGQGYFFSRPVPADQIGQTRLSHPRVWA